MWKQTKLEKVINEDIFDKYGIHAAFQKYAGKFSLEDVFTTDSVFICANRCASGFMHKPDTYNFMDSVWLNSYSLCQEVLNGEFLPKYYSTTVINERGKQRVIKPPSFECKVVQKAIADYVIRPILEPKMVSTSYASIKGKGTLKMYEAVLKALNKYIKEPKEYVVIMTDFKGYFDSIPIEKLMAVFGRYIDDPRVLELIHAFSPDEYGLSLGNELSQVPASFYPSLFDHFVKDNNAIPYFRYMDDTLAIVEKDKSDWYVNEFFRFTDELGLKALPEKVNIVPLGKPFIFCKERFLWDKKKERYYSLVNPSIEKVERRKIKAFGRKIAEGKMDFKEAENQYKGVTGGLRNRENATKMLERLDAVWQEEVLAKVNEVSK